MIQLFPMKKGQSYSGDYILEDGESFDALLPYLYPRIDGEWKVVIIDPDIKTLRHLYTLTIPTCVDLRVYADGTDISQFALEKPDLQVTKVSSYALYEELFKDISVVFEPRAVSEIYNRAGPDIDNLKTALSDVIQVSNGEYVTMADVNKVLLPNKRVYTSDIVRAFIVDPRIKYRWSLANKYVEELGQDYAYYALRKYVFNLLKYKAKYLRNEDIPQRFQRDVTEIDAFTIDYAYSLFCEYSKPTLLPAVLYKLERRLLCISTPRVGNA